MSYSWSWYINTGKKSKNQNEQASQDGLVCFSSIPVRCRWPFAVMQLVAFFTFGLRTHVCSLLVVCSHLLHLISTWAARTHYDTELRRNPPFCQDSSSHSFSSIRGCLGSIADSLPTSCLLQVMKTAVHISIGCLHLTNIFLQAFIFK